MSGNVWEWTRSIWGSDWERPAFSYPYPPDDAPREDLRAGDSILRVVRGGWFGADEIAVRAAFRRKYLPPLRDDGLGFRVVVCRTRT
jgi:formylglycine-generating enzyme required for sulfatase activity